MCLLATDPNIVAPLTSEGLGAGHSSLIPISDNPARSLQFRAMMDMRAVAGQGPSVPK